MNRVLRETKQILALFLCAIIFLSYIPVLPVYAEDVASPMVTVSNATAVAGNNAYVYISVSDFVDVAGLELTVYYDPDVMSVSSTTMYTLLQEANIKEIDTSTSGQIKMSLIDIDGITGGGNLFRAAFSVSQSAAAGSYRIAATIGDAYDKSFAPVTIKKTEGTITVTEPQQSIASAYFYSNMSTSSAQEGDELTYTVVGSSLGNLTCGNFNFNYDSSYLELQSVTLSDAMKIATSLYSINDSKPGYASLSYTGIEPMQSFNVSLKFKVVKDETATTSVVFTGDGLTDCNLNMMKTDGCSSSVSITKKPVVVTYPEFRIDAPETLSAKEFTATVVIDGDSNVEAGGFTIQYDTDKLECLEATADAAVGEAGGTVITKEKINAGTVRFSFIMDGGFDDDLKLLNIKFKVKGHIGSTFITTAGSSVYNGNFEPVTLDYKSATVTVPDDHVYGDWVVDEEPTCAEEGSKHRTCAICDNVDTGAIETLPHTLAKTEAKAATCTEAGNSAYWHCSECGKYFSDAEGKTEVAEDSWVIEALKHKYKYEWNWGSDHKTAKLIVTCERDGCDFREEITASVSSEVTKNASCTEAGETTYTAKASFGGKEYSDTYVDTTQPGKKGHTLSKTEAKAATCTEDGVSFDYWYCLDCKKYFTDAEGTTQAEKDSWVISRIDTIVLTCSEYVYDGSEKEPTAEVKDAVGNTLTEGTDYEISYSENTEPGTATATITFIGKYSGSVERTFEIKSGLKLSGTVTGYSGEALKIVLCDEEGKEYSAASNEYEFTGLKSGTYTLTASADGDYVPHEYSITIDEESITQDITLYQLGDTNCDGKRSAEDITRLARHVAKISEESDEYKLLLFNTDRSTKGDTAAAKVDAADITHLARFVAKIIEEL